MSDDQSARQHADDGFTYKPAAVDDRAGLLRRWWIGPLIFIVIVGGGVIGWKVYANSQMEADIPAIENAIVEDQADQGFAVSVDCPSSVDWEVGGEFHCIATDDQDGRYRVTVSMENADGDVTWAFE